MHEKEKSKFLSQYRFDFCPVSIRFEKEKTTRNEQKKNDNLGGGSLMNFRKIFFSPLLNQ